MTRSVSLAGQTFLGAGRSLLQKSGLARETTGAYKGKERATNRIIGA